MLAGSLSKRSWQVYSYLSNMTATETCEGLNSCFLRAMFIECGLALLYPPTCPKTTFRRRRIPDCCPLLLNMRTHHHVLCRGRCDVYGASLGGRASRGGHTSRLPSAIIRFSQVDHHHSHACLVCDYGREIQFPFPFSEVDRSDQTIDHILVVCYIIQRGRLRIWGFRLLPCLSLLLRP